MKALTKMSFIVIIEEFVLVDGPYTKLPFHSRDERGPLEQCSRQLLKGLVVKKMDTTVNIR